MGDRAKRIMVDAAEELMGQETLVSLALMVAAVEHNRVELKEDLHYKAVATIMDMFVVVPVAVVIMVEVVLTE